MITCYSSGLSETVDFWYDYPQLKLFDWTIGSDTIGSDKHRNKALRIP